MLVDGAGGKNLIPFNTFSSSVLESAQDGTAAAASRLNEEKWHIASLLSTQHCNIRLLVVCIIVKKVHIGSQLHSCVCAT